MYYSIRYNKYQLVHSLSLGFNVSLIGNPESGDNKDPNPGVVNKIKMMKIGAKSGVKVH